MQNISLTPGPSPSGMVPVLAARQENEKMVELQLHALTAEQ